MKKTLQYIYIYSDKGFKTFVKNLWKGGSLFITSFLNGAKEEVESY